MKQTVGSDQKSPAD